MTVLIGMFLLGLFIALGSWTVSWSNHVKKELVVKVYFLPTATKADKNDLARSLQQNPYVRPGGITYISKETALQNMKQKYPDARQEPDVEPVPRHAPDLPGPR